MTPMAVDKNIASVIIVLKVLKEEVCVRMHYSGFNDISGS